MKLPTDKQTKKALRFLSKFQTSIILVFIGLALIGMGLSVIKIADSGKEPQFIESDSEDSTNKLTVDVSGAVKNPGVYSFSVGTRRVEAIEAAGGFSENADKNFIASSLNLAAKVSDGEKIFIPAQGRPSSNNPGAGSAGEVSSVVNINTASESQLDTLYGIGPVRAGKIIANRPYASIDELVTKKVLGEATFEKIRDKISVF